jgi:hypothetical protein
MDDGQFGAPAGTIGESSVSNLKNEFRSIPDVSISQYAQDSRVLPRDVATGPMRGTTQRYADEDGNYITIGIIPETNNELGIAFFDRDDNLISKMTALTDYVYNPGTGKNVYQQKKLPDGTYGVAGANDGYDVADGYE